MGGPLTDGTQAEHVLQERAEARALAAIAHELRNPLEILDNFLYLIANDPRSSLLQMWVSQAQEEVDAMRQVTNGLLEASTEGLPGTEVGLSKILQSSVQALREKAELKRVKVEERLDCPGVITSSEAEIRHAFGNILNNALEALHEGGKITVHLFESRDWKEPGKRGCRVVIADNGTGISPEHRNKIFEPFFTTKAEKGTGIGLWIVRRIVRKNRGSIHVRSCTSQGMRGTTFSIFLPKDPLAAAESVFAVNQTQR